MYFGDSVIDFNVSQEETQNRLIRLQQLCPPCSPDLYIQQKNQEEIRSHANMVFDEIVGERAPKKLTRRKKPNYFGLQICCITNITSSITNDSLLRNVVATPIDEHFTEEENAEFIDEKFKCACGQSVSRGNIWKITNPENGKFIHAGSECILKHRLLTQEQLNKLKKEKKEKIKRQKKEREIAEKERIRREQEERIRKQKKEEDERRLKESIIKRNHKSVMDELVRKKRLEEENRIKKEQEEEKQLELERLYRRCKTCNQFRILKTEDWKKDCTECYFNQKRKNEHLSEESEKNLAYFEMDKTFWIDDDRVYLKIPFEKKGLIKNIGGRWDAPHKLWYISYDLYDIHKDHIHQNIGRIIRWICKECTELKKKVDEGIIAEEDAFCNSCWKESVGWIDSDCF